VTTSKRVGFSGRVLGVAMLTLALGCGGSDTGGPREGVNNAREGGKAGSGGRSTGGSGGGSAAAGSGGGGALAGSTGMAAAGGSGGSTAIDAPVEMDSAVAADATVDTAPPDGRPALATGAIPDPWKGEDIGMVGVPGGSGRNRRQMHVLGSGGDIWAESDAFRFLHRPVTGDVEIVARLTGIERTNQDAKAGVMFRETTAPDSRNVFMLAFPTNTNAAGVVSGKGTRLQFRDKRVDNLTGFVDLASLALGQPDGAPLWLRLTRKGPLFEGFMSADGATWRKDGEIMMTLPAQLAVGLAVTAHSGNNASLASFEGVRITALTDPAWVHAELGTVGGFAAGAPRRFELQSAGRGIANSEDGITFVHRATQHIGDVEVTARVAGLKYPGNRSARIGIMLRGSMGAGARMAAFVLELGPNGQRYRLQRRAQDGGNISTSEDNLPDPTPAADGGAPAGSDAAADAGAAATPAMLKPTWLKLVRVGHRFVGFISEDGRRWTAVVDLPSFVIASNAFVGVTLTSGTEGESALGQIENVTIASPTTALPVRPDAGADAASDADDNNDPN
jgi:regulation of enolase protein 1 (concanavalin A-like superfamily)